MIEGHDLRIERGRKVLLRDVSCQVRPGEILAVMGPNGAGKSTLLKCLTGSLAPSAGHVSIDGQDQRAVSARDLAQRRAVLSQSRELAFPFPVADVVMMGRHPHSPGAITPADRGIAQAVMQRTGVWDLRHEDYTVLSGGEKQRVQLARTLTQIWPDAHKAHEPRNGHRYIFLDEPTAALDLKFQQMIFTLAHELKAAGLGIMMILHEPYHARQHADQVLLLKAGQRYAMGTPDAVLGDDVLCDLFDLTAPLSLNGPMA